MSKRTRAVSLAVLPLVAILMSSVASAVTANAATAATRAPDHTCTNPSFVTSSPTGGHTFGKYYVYNNMWGIAGYSVSQTLSACNYNNWYVIADMNNDSGDGAVKTYPNVQENFNSVPITSFTKLTSTFAESDPHVGIYEDAYDMWINGVASSGATEVMIWNENYNQVPAGSIQGTVTIGPRTYTVWKNGNYVAFVAKANFTSGTLNILRFYKYIMNRGWMPRTSVVDQIDYGAELVSTNSAPVAFQFNNFSINAQQ
jgi:Glycosyl hydrolase family 12